ncbi:hypothetical protein LWC34_00515 [Kibdelosporangium philippinense]|uniref:PE domain-containing protein n=1 Tax=Kibdelosporangium philippinense TaxID=211113 RepID=A0ABS8Z3H0_9PSEU|nr:hypothetical protein [Kibdelosporangium philippinense]MCE7001330.1 hypothetical protein [Kibdelosporangium philippinense]
MASFANLAASGGFEVNEAGGEALIKAIQRMRDWANGQVLDLRQLAQQMPLGTSHAAKVMKPYVQQVAIDDQGFLTQLAKFVESLDKAEQGIRTAMANYKATEEANRTSLGNMEV